MPGGGPVIPDARILRRLANRDASSSPGWS